MRQGQNGRRGPRRPHQGGNPHQGNGGGGGQHNHAPRGEAPRRSAATLRNQSFDSNGPDVRVRGNAWQVFEKYQSLARDAQMAGDRVAEQSYLQYAEHYYRIIEAINEATAAEQAARGFSGQQPDARGLYPQQQPQPQPAMSGEGAQVEMRGAQPQPTITPQPDVMVQPVVTQQPTSPFFTPEEAAETTEQPTVRAAGL